MKSLTFDTNSFLRYLLNDIPEQADQVSELLARAKVKQLTIFIPQIVIFEVEFALDKYYKFSKPEVVDKLTILLAAPYLKIQDREVFQEALIIFKSRKIDFVDCFLLSGAKIKNSTLFTFDKDLQMLAE